MSANLRQFTSLNVGQSIGMLFAVAVAYLAAASGLVSWALLLADVAMSSLRLCVQASCLGQLRARMLMRARVVAPPSARAI